MIDFDIVADPARGAGNLLAAAGEKLTLAHAGVFTPSQD